MLCEPLLGTKAYRQITDHRLPQSIFHDIIYTTHNSRKNGLKLRQFTFFPNYALFIERGCQNASLSGSLCFELTEQKSLDSSHGVRCLLAECLQLHISILLGVQQ